MLGHASVSVSDLAYERFLYASICEQNNGTQVTVLSALVRADIDPWEEASRLARAESESRGNIEFDSPSNLRSKLDWPRGGSGLCALGSASSNEGCWESLLIYVDWRSGSLDLLAGLVRPCASGLSQLTA